MFDWFRPICPCDPAAKAWIESRLRWLTEEFGLPLLLERPIILPLQQFFPEPWDGSDQAVQRMFRTVCRWMRVAPGDVELGLFNDSTSSSILAIDPTIGVSAGTWSGRPGRRKAVIRLERGNLDRPADLIAVMAHELAHQRLLGEDRLDRNAFDNELLTDLTAVFHGFGVFLANNPRSSTGALSKWPGTELNKPEYLSEPMLGFALALIAWFRNEDRPEWVRHLRGAPRAVFKQGLRFLEKTGDS